MKLVNLLWTTIAVLLVGNVFFSNHSADLVADIRSNESAVTTLIQEVSILKYRVSESGSLTKMAQLAKDSGYETSRQIVSLSPIPLTASR